MNIKDETQYTVAYLDAEIPVWIVIGKYATRAEAEKVAQAWRGIFEIVIHEPSGFVIG